MELLLFICDAVSRIAASEIQKPKKREGSQMNKELWMTNGGGIVTDEYHKALY